MGKMTNTTLFSLIHDFFKIYLPNERKFSAHTIRAYQKALELLLDFVKLQKNVRLSNITFEMIDRKMLTDFLEYLELDRGCSVATRNHRLNCIRAFYGYVAKIEITAVKYWEEIKKVDTAIVSKKPIGHMSEKAVETILSQPNTTTRKGLRDMFLMLLLYQTGARIQELLDIRLCDIHFGSTPSILLHGKWSKIRSVPIREKTTEHLKSYIDIFHPTENMFSEQTLFYVNRNNTKKRMTEDNARHLIRKYGEKARIKCSEVPFGVHPHLFRHSIAMHLYQNGVELALVSQWLGHAQLETTLIYAHADTELKRKAIAAAMPENGPLNEHINSERYKIDDEELLKLLCGLK